MSDAFADFAKELDELAAEPGPQQASASAAAQPTEPNIIDPVFQADAWGKYHREQQLAYQQAQSGQSPGQFPQRPNRVGTNHS